MAFGAYVHVPFCTHRCDYCDFATWTDRGHLVDDYVDACVTDARRRRAGATRSIDSVFFGGGTPSLLAPDQVARVLEALGPAPGAEVTLECNPDTVDRARFAGYAAAGVDRVSIGVQSMVEPVLRALGRTHDPANVERAVEAARRAGIGRVNVDLIYGACGETLHDWRRTLDRALALAPDHVSAYALTVEPATSLGRRVAAGEVPAPDDDDQAEKYRLADEVLGAAGLAWYEISNWSRPGQACRHNELYWSGGDYLAIGAAAHGHLDGRRTWNVRPPERYVERVRAGADPVAGGEDLDARARAEERFALALRTCSGATVAPAAAGEVAALARAGLVAARAERVVLTLDGRLLADDLTARLVLAGAAGVWHSVESSANAPPARAPHP